MEIPRWRTACDAALGTTSNESGFYAAVCSNLSATRTGAIIAVLGPGWNRWQLDRHDDVKSGRLLDLIQRNQFRRVFSAQPQRILPGSVDVQAALLALGRLTGRTYHIYWVGNIDEMLTEQVTTEIRMEN